VVALVRGVHGLNGAVRVEVLTDRPEERFVPGAVLHREGRPEPLTIESATAVADGPGWRLRFRELPGRSGAESLRGAYLEAVVQPETLAELSRQPYFRRLLAAGIFAAFTGILVEFQFYLAAASAGHTASESIAFFADLYLAVSALALVVQLGLLARLQRRIGLGRSLLVLPATLALLTPAAILSASLVLRSV